MSSPANNRLVYTTPSISALFNDIPLSNFESFSTITMNLAVVPASSEKALTCAGNCNVIYDWGYTPIVRYMIPSIVFPGIHASVAVNPKKAPYYKSSTQMFAGVKIDGVSLDFADYYDEEYNPGANSLVSVTGEVMTE
jgi:hypothetical protein